MVDRRLEAQLVISAKDDTGTVLAGVQKHLDQLGQSLKSLSALGSTSKPLAGLSRQLGEIDKAAAGVAKLAASLDRMGRQESRIARIAGHLRGLDFASGAFSTAAFGKAAFKAGSMLQDAKLDMRMAGVPLDELAAHEARAGELAKKYPRVTSAEILHMTKELRSVLQDAHEVPHMIEPMVRAKAVLDAMDHSGEASSGLGLLARGSESIGAAKDPARFEKLLDGYVKAMQVMGRTINPEAIYKFDKYIKNSGAQLSDRFLMTSGLSLSQEIGGDTAGNSINMATRYVRGGWRNQHQALTELVRLGLVDKSDVDYNKKMDMVRGIKPGHKDFLKGQSLLLSDPDLWTYQYALPALAKAGLTSTDDQLATFEKLFPKSDAATFFGKIITQRTAFENHAKLYGQAAGLSGADMLRESASASLAGVSGSLTNLIATASEPQMGKAAEHLNSLSTALGHWTDLVREDPRLGAGGLVASGLGAGLFGTGAVRLLMGKSLGLAGMARFGLPAAAAGGAWWALQQSYADDGRMWNQPAEYGEGAGGTAAKLLELDQALGMARAKGGGSSPEAAMLQARRDLLQGKLQAEVRGEATVDVKVEVSPSPDFITRVIDQAKAAIMPLVGKAAQDAVSASGIGSTGSSSRGMEDRR